MPLEIFYSYAHADEALRQHMETHLSLLQRQGLISEWHDRHILAGDEWARDIDQHLETASIILLLISPDFLASDYCYDIEMQRALERHRRGEAHVIPIIVRPVDWHSAPFGHLQCLPRDGKAVTTWQNPDEAFLAIAQGLRRIIEQQRIPTHPLPEVERKNRRALIKRVRTTWIEGLLEHSLHEAARLELHLQERPDVLTNPWRLQVQELDRPPQPLPAGTSIVQVYDEADGELLILGEPGAGKTTLLLELARTLLDRAEADERHRIPVVFNLSSWAEKRPPLSEWLVEELWTKYQIPRKIGRSWVASDRLLPLLDGLDEVAEKARVGCVQAINAYYQQRVEQGPAPLVVCCRSKEYMALPTRVTLHQAVSIQPLTQEQIELFVRSAGGQLKALRQTLHNDPELYELARRPLMLSVFTLAYQEATLADLPTAGTHEAKLRQVFTTYVKRMLTRRGAPRHGTLEQCKYWPAFLAAQMQQHHQTVFFVGQLQPDWLEDRRRRFMYRLSVALLIGLLIGPLSGLFFGLLFGLVVGLASGVVFGLVIGVVVGLQNVVQRISFRNKINLSWKRGTGTRWSFILELKRFDEVNGIWLSKEVVRVNLPWKRRTRWSFRPELKRFDEGNQGIWLSEVLFLLLDGVLLGLLLGLFFGFSLLGGPLAGLYIGLYIGLLVPLVIVGAFSQVLALRFWLWRAGSLPWNMVAFLDEAAERLLLRKVGGGYIFIHRLLLDYFASLEKKEP